MSVIIKGMEMPKRHLFEAFVAIGDGQIVVKDLKKNKLFWGKIEEVRTPHGRLIDADRLLESIKTNFYEHFGNYDSGQELLFDLICNSIEDSLTIIEADVSE